MLQTNKVPSTLVDKVKHNNMKINILSIFLLLSINTFAQDTTDLDHIMISVVEDMPSFPGCDTLKTNNERKQCTEQQLLKFIYRNAKYPMLYRENSIFGLVVVSFIVNTDGKIEDVKIIKDIGGLWANEIKRVLLMMNDLAEPWTAGTQRGKKVKVKYNFPIRIQLSMN